MKIPEPRKLPPGNYFIQLRLGGESISVTDSSRTACIREVRAMNAEYLAGKRAKAAPEDPTLTEAIDSYIAQRSNTLSPLTIWCYRSIQKHRFQTTMPRRLDQIADEGWQGIVNMEAALCAPKTLKTAFAFVRGVVARAVQSCQSLPSVSCAQRETFSHTGADPGLCGGRKRHPVRRSGAAGPSPPCGSPRSRPCAGRISRGIRTLFRCREP